MAGAVHESVLELIREHPFLLKTLLERQGVELSFDKFQLPAKSDLGQLQPTRPMAFRSIAVKGWRWPRTWAFGCLTTRLP